MLQGTYDPQKVTVLFTGTLFSIQAVGFAAGTFIKASRNSELFSLQMGNDGQGARSKNPDKSGRVELTLMSSSQSNDEYMAVAALDELSSQGVGVLFIKDNSTASAMVHAANAWITKIPDLERGKEVGEITWVIESDAIEIIQSGQI